MFRLNPILIINGIVLFMLISCHNKTNNSRNAISLEYENCDDSLTSDEINRSHFITSIQPGETIVKEMQMQDKKFIKKKNEQIKVCFLIKDPCSKDGFLKTEITNNVNDTISYMRSTFSYYKESDDSCIPLIYPNNYVQNDIGYSIPPQRSIQIKLFIPPQKEFLKGKYKLQLLFHSTSENTYYCIDKFFFYTTPEPVIK